MKATLEDRKNENIRKIILAGLDSSPVEGIRDDFRSGETISIKGPLHELRGRVEFKRYNVQVTMLSPFECTSKVRYGCRTIPHGMLSFDGAATSGCLEMAAEMLKGLYCDWMLLDMQKEALKERYETLAMSVDLLRELERRDKAHLLETMRPLEQLSMDLKQRLRNGYLTQKDYMELKAPLRRALSRMHHDYENGRDFFAEAFRDELFQCRTVDQPGTLLRKVLNVKTDCMQQKNQP